jgi:hypothetical protein
MSAIVAFYHQVASKAQSLSSVDLTVTALCITGAPNGSFVLRESESVPGNFTIAVLNDNMIKNFRIEKVGLLVRRTCSQFERLRAVCDSHVLADAFYCMV